MVKPSAEEVIGWIAGRLDDIWVRYRSRNVTLAQMIKIDPGFAIRYILRCIERQELPTRLVNETEGL